MLRSGRRPANLSGSIGAATIREKVLLALLVSAAIVGVAVVGYIVVLVAISRSPGWFHRARLEAVVAEVRRPFPANEVVELYLHDVSNPLSLRPWDHRPVGIGTGAGRVWAERTAEGHLKVVIETTDGGHDGQYGFAFSDVPLVPGLGVGGPYIDVPGGLHYLQDSGAQIDEHWWRVFDNMF